MDVLVDGDDERGDDHREEVFFERDPRDLDPRSELDLEDADLEGVPVPDVGDRIDREHGDGGLPERARTSEQTVGDRPPEDDRREVGVLPEDGDVRLHGPTREGAV